MSGEIVPRGSYLIARNGVYYFDMRVPADVDVAYAAKFKTKAIRVSLRTRDRRKALRLMGEELERYTARFDELRREANANTAFAAKAARHDLTKMTRSELERMVTDYYRDVVRRASISPPIDREEQAELVEEWNDTLIRVRDRRDEEGNERIRNTADHLLLKAGWATSREAVVPVEPPPEATPSEGKPITRHLPSVDVDRTAEQYRALTDLVRRASIEGSRLALAELRGTPFTPADPLFAEEFSLTAATSKQGPLLSEALASWKEGSGVRGSRKPRELTAMEAATAAKRFIELHGDIHVAEITKKRVHEFAAAISALPARLPKKLAKLPLPNLLREDLSSLPPRAPGTINKAFQLLSAVVEDARKRSELEEAATWPNHFPAARIDANESEERDREPFSADDLRRIFNEGPVHGQGKRQDGGQGEAQYWLPLLALFTGARLSELGQLRACDVLTDDSGIAFVSIGTSGGRTVKTRTSIRRVPVHPELKRLGFLGYVERVKAAAGAEVTLWPLLGSASGRARTAAFSQWWGNYLRREPIGIADKRKAPMHAFRHLFKDACRDAGLSEDVHDALTGHAAGKSVGRGYGAGHSVARLYAEISKVKLPVDLSHLSTSKVRKAPPGWGRRRG